MPLIYTKNSFIEAAENGDIDLLKKHFHGAFFKESWLDAIDSHGRTALYCAARNGHAEIVKKLIYEGADVNLLSNDKFGDRWSPLAAACNNNHSKTVEVLLQAKADPHHSSNDNIPLICAAKFGYTEIVKRLLAAGAKADISDSSGCQPLHHAAIRGAVSTAKELLDAKADINATTAHDMTALHYAVKNKEPSMISFLLQNGAKTDVPNRSSRTALDIAKEEKYSLGGRLIRRHLGLSEDEGQGNEEWIIISADSIARVGIYPEIKHKLTEIFNFASRERKCISENMDTRIETTLAPESFDLINDAALRRAFNAFRQQGGQADENFVFSHSRIEKGGLRLQK